MRKLLLFSTLLISSSLMWAQITLSTYPGASANNGSAGITFELITTQSITLNEIYSQLSSTGSSTYTLWYKTGGYTYPVNISAAGGWTQVQTGSSASGSGRSTPVLFASNLNLVLQPGTYGIHMTTSNCGYKSWAGSPDSWSDGTVTINTGQNKGIGGSAPSPSFTWRQFCGSIVYDINASAPNDIGVTSIDSPAVFCQGTENVVATIRNYGTNQVDSFTVNWAVNGVTQTPVVKTNVLLDTLFGTGSQELQVALGSWAFTQGQPDTIEVWTTLPNNVTDTVTSNDSDMVVKQPAISGNFTIDPLGSGAGNYATFSAAAQDLSDFGVCGPVTYLVAPGTYNEQVSFDKIAGTSSINTITFTADTGGVVAIQHSASGSSDDYVIEFDDASWISFDNFTFSAQGTGSYACALKFDGGSSNNSITNCQIEGSTTSSSSLARTIQSNSAGNNANTFMHNTIIGGYYGVYFRGGSTTATNEDNVWENNIFEDAYRYGAYYYYSTNLKWNKNKVSSSRNYSSMYGFYSYYSYKASEIIGNDINIPGYAAMWLGYHEGNNNDKPLIANNFLRVGKNAGSYGYGLYCVNAGFARIVNNTIVSTHSTGTYRNVYITGGANVFLNNNVYETNGYSTSTSYAAIYFNGSFAVLESDHNNVYSNRNFGYFNGPQIDLAAWQANTPHGANSLDSDPGFINYDSLRTCSDTLDGAGTPLSYVTNDFDGDGRHPSTPDIGADEWVGNDSTAYSAGDDALVCGNEVTIGLPTSGGSFLWSTSDTTSTITVTEAGTYTVAMTSICGASHVDTVEVEDATAIADFDVTVNFLTGDFLNKSDKDSTRMWVVNVNPADTFTGKDLTYLFPDNGPYQVDLYIYNDCDTDMVSKQWKGYVGIDENSLVNQISLMPNPASSNLNVVIEGVEGDITVEMMNIQGQIVHSDRYSVNGNKTKSIDVSSLRKGMYIVKFITDSEIATKQVIVQ